MEILCGGGLWLGHPCVVGRPPLLGARGRSDVSEFAALRQWVFIALHCFGSMFVMVTRGVAYRRCKVLGGTMWLGVKPFDDGCDSPSCSRC